MIEAVSPAKKKNTRTRNQNTTPAKKEQDNSSKNTTKEDAPLDLSKFVSNLDKNVYAISNLPEEFVATLFAWVSRSPKSFRVHLAEAIKDLDIKESGINSFQTLSDKAMEFHEKWTVGYGHSSVAEHATTHVGIEKISRLASAELELSNTFLSITEYSQRYQQPKRGEWYNPFEKKTKQYDKVEAYYNSLFDIFEELITSVHSNLDQKHLKETGNEPTSRESLANKKLAFEDARYVLPLAMYTQLGLTANGRAWRDGLAVLGTSEHVESKQLAEDLKVEISKVLPTLLKYADPSEYQESVVTKLRENYSKLSSNSNAHWSARLLPVQPEQTLVNEILAHYISSKEGRPLSDSIHQVTRTSQEHNNELFDWILKGMKSYDTPPEAFKHVRYRADFIVSEANWHQLLRHNRMTDFTFGKPSISNGVTMPPRIREAGQAKLFSMANALSVDIYNELAFDGEQISHLDYLVLNAHRRVVTASFSLWELYHLINLRTSDEAQWDIKDTFEELYEQLMNVHPRLISAAKRR